MILTRTTGCGGKNARQSSPNSLRQFQSWRYILAAAYRALRYVELHEEFCGIGKCRYAINPVSRGGASVQVHDESRGLNPRIFTP